MAIAYYLYLLYHAVKLVMWIPHSLPLRQRGTFLLTSTIIFLARSHIALKWLALGPKLNHPCSSMGYLCNKHIRWIHVFSLIPRKFRVSERRIIAEAPVESPSFYSPHMPAIPCHVFRGILNFKYLWHPHKNCTAEINIVKVIKAFSHSYIKGNRCSCCPSKVNPVSRSDYLRRSFRTHEPISIHLLKIHKTTAIFL